MNIRVREFLKNREVNNAGWLIGGKIAQMCVALFVGLWTARYLGPSNYGLINYVASYTALFTSICTLGITASILVNEFTQKPNDEGVTLGTAIGLRLLSSFFSALMIVSIVSIVDKDEPTTILIAIVSSFSLFFQVFDLIEYWFQKYYLSKVISVATFVGYVISALYKIILLLTESSVVLFSLASTIDYAVLAAVLLISYKKYNGPELKFSFKRGKEILGLSYHFILSGMMVAIYGQTDKIMLKHMLSETEVGYYSTAASLSTIWVFVLAAIITSMTPSIMQFKKDGKEVEYNRKNRQLYGIIFYVSITVSVIFTLFASLIVSLLYGDAYNGAIDPLRIITWYVAFSYLGVARDNWMVCENLQRYSKYMYIIACVVNIGLNYIFIPRWGASGAAFASLITQIMTSIGIPLLFKEMRPNVKLILEGITFKDYRKQHCI